MHAVRVAWCNTVFNSSVPNSGSPVPRMIDDVIMPAFSFLVDQEVAMARKHHARLNSAHEAYAVILEKLDELKCEVWKRRERRDHTSMLLELVQVAAMCQRAAEDLGLLDAKGVELDTTRYAPKGGAS